MKALGPMLIAAAVLCPFAAAAHPSVSIVMDGRGVVYFSDLANVWMIGPDRSKSVAVADVHTHELWLDDHGALYGEDVRNEGPRYRHCLYDGR